MIVFGQETKATENVLRDQSPEFQGEFWWEKRHRKIKEKLQKSRIVLDHIKKLEEMEL